jgi:general secretion pathway protein D
MEIEQIISAVSKDSAAGTLTPVITQRSFTSTISVVSGQTVILGGLISQEEDATATGLPFLSRLKFLGNVGGDRDNTRKRTELVMFIQPEIIRNGVDAQRVTEEMAAKLRKMVQPDAGDVIIDK